MQGSVFDTFRENPPFSRAADGPNVSDPKGDESQTVDSLSNRIDLIAKALRTAPPSKALLNDLMASYIKTGQEAIKTEDIPESEPRELLHNELTDEAAKLRFYLTSKSAVARAAWIAQTITAVSSFLVPHSSDSDYSAGVTHEMITALPTEAIPIDPGGAYSLLRSIVVLLTVIDASKSNIDLKYKNEIIGFAYEDTKTWLDEVIVYYHGHESDIEDMYADVVDMRVGAVRLDISYSLLSVHKDRRPSLEAQQQASSWLSLAIHQCGALGTWRSPHITANDSAEVAFEWWNPSICRRLLVWFDGTSTKFLKSLGTGRLSDMEDGEASQADSVGLMQWMAG